jgi:hypothetical protein
MEFKPQRTQAQIDLNFTKEQGLDIQKRHLKEFKSVMSASAFDLLSKKVTAGNDQAYDGFDIIRGNDIDVILHNDVIPVFYR